MKKLGILAVVFTLLFVVFAVIGGIMTAVGGVDVLSEVGTRVSQELESYDNTDLDLDINIPIFDSKVGKSNFDVSVDLTGVEKIVLFEGAVCRMDIRPGNTDKLTVEVDGEFPLAFLEEYSILGGELFELGEVTKSGPVEIRRDGSTIELSIDGDMGIGADYKMRVTVPSNWNGSLELGQMVSLVRAEHLELESLRIAECTAKVEFDDVRVGSVEITECLSEVNVDGIIGSFVITECLGEIEVETDVQITGESSITENVGRVSVSLPNGKVDVDTSNNLGRVNVDGRTSGGTRITVRDNMGGIEIDIDD